MSYFGFLYSGLTQYLGSMEIFQSPEEVIEPSLDFSIFVGYDQFLQ